MKQFIESLRLTDTNTLHFQEYGKKTQELGLPLELSVLFKEYGGATFEYGLIRIHNSGSSYYWTEICSNYFNFEKERMHCFAFDWLGRNYAIDLKKKNTILMLDYATGEYFELEQTIERFFSEDLVDYRSDTLSEDTFNLIRKRDNKEVKFDSCYSFKIPLFLGGEDETCNYEIADMAVCWEINYQLYLKVSNLPPNQVIGKISFD